MEIIVNPERERWLELTERNLPDDTAVTDTVERIIADVKEHGDKALREYALRFDGSHLNSILISEAEIEEAVRKVAPNVRQAMERGAENIRAFHAAQMPREVDVTTMPGVRCLQRAVPIQRVGLYIPGGRAPLFSTVLMLGIPANIASCPSVTLCTPRSNDGPIAPEILYAAKLCGIHRVFAIGGAQAIAAMALGTESVPKVDKIFGPGNRFVTRAKQMLSNEVAIDMPAGPSEVLVMADESALPLFVASDMLSQAEHGPDSQAICVCSSESLAAEIAKHVEETKKRLTRSDSIDKSLSHSRIIVFHRQQDAIDFINIYASEHLILAVKDPWKVAERITSAGSVFIGNWSPESAGDYASGTNHTLPTNGWARSFSGVNIDSFMRKITYQELTRDGLKGIAPIVEDMATAEGLDAHALAVKLRITHTTDSE